MDDEQGYIKNEHKPQDRVEEVQSWVRRHKDQLIVGSILVLGVKQRRTAKRLNKVIEISLEHAKVTKNLSDVVKVLAEEASVFDRYFGRR